MGDEWKKVQLDEIATISSGKRPAKVSKQPTEECAVPVIGGGGISGYTNRALWEEDVLITGRVGTLGKLFATSYPCWPSDNTLVIHMSEANIDGAYLRYAVELSIPQVAAMNRGAANPLITQGDIGRLNIPLPPLTEQHAIAHILGSLDDKIELNQQMAQTLESIARAIFKSWFVDFDPVKAKMEGKQPEGMSEEVAALFPDKFVESELGMIPEGWEAKPFGELLEHHIGGGWGKEKPDEKHTLPAHVIRGTDIPGAKKGIIDNVPLRYHTASNLKSRRLHAGDIVFEVSGGSKDQPVGRALLVNEAILSALSGDTICASFCKLMRPRNETVSSFMLYLHIEEIYKNRRIMEYQTQSTGISNLKFSDFLNRDFVLVPVNGVRKAFDRHMVTLFDQMAGLGKQNWILRQIRETLLPQLISGKIRLNQPEDAAA